MDAKVLGLIYEAALEPDRWTDAIAAVASSVKAEGGQILLWDERSGGAAFTRSVGSGASDQAHVDRLYNDYYGIIDPRRNHAMTLPVQQWMACHHICDDRFVARSEFYQDYFIPVLDSRYMCGTRLAGEQGLHAMLAIARRAGPQARPFNDAALAQLKELTPHLSRAARLQLQIAGLRRDLTVRESALSHLSVPLFVMTRDAVIRFSNSAGERMIGTPSSGLFSKTGRLCARSADEETRLKAAVADAVDARVGASLLIGAGSPSPVLCTVIPLSERSGLPAGDQVPMALVLIGDRRIDRAEEIRMVQAIFNLTPAESRLALGLASGRSLDQLAGDYGVAMATVKAQLQSVYTKVGVNRQGALISLLQRLLPPLQD